MKVQQITKQVQRMVHGVEIHLLYQVGDYQLSLRSLINPGRKGIPACSIRYNGKKKTHTDIHIDPNFDEVDGEKYTISLSSPAFFCGSLDSFEEMVSEQRKALGTASLIRSQILPEAFAEAEYIRRHIERHVQNYSLKGDICAYYSDWNDFCSDWCDGLGYTEDEAYHLFRSEIGEFMKLPQEQGILRFVV